MKFRDVLFWIHLSMGLTVGSLVLVIVVSGILLSLRPQVTAWSEREQTQVFVPSDGQKMDLDQMASRVRAQYPDTPITGLSLSSKPTSSVLFNLGRDKVCYVDPYDGRILGEGSVSVRSFFQTVEGFHRWFGFQNVDREKAKQVKGAVTLIFGLMVLSGLYLWWPRQWNQAVFKVRGVPSAQLEGKQRYWNWHHAFGFWSAPWLLLIILTGLVMVYPWASDLLFKMTGNEVPSRPQVQNQIPVTQASVKKDLHHNKKHKASAFLQKLVKAVDVQSPQWKSINLRLPQSGKTDANASVEEATAFAGFTRASISLDSITGKVLKWEPYQDRNIGRKLLLWSRFVHTGEAGGWFGQIIAALACFSVLVSIWTGFSLAWRRFQKQA